MHRRRLSCDTPGARVRRSAVFLVVALATSLLPSPSLAGTGFGAITGTVYGPTGMPVGGVVVYVCNTTCDYAETAANGVYVVGNLDPGSYRILFEDYSGALPAGYATTTGLTVDRTQAAFVTVADVSVTFDVHVPAGRLISGQITNQSAAGVADAWVSACIDGSGIADRDWICGYDFAEADGTYSMALLPGKYRVYAADDSNVAASGYWSTAGYSFSYKQATVLVVATTDLTGISFSLPPGASISGTVTNAAGPAVAVLAEACSTADLIGCRTDFTAADGSYAISGLPIGSYTVIFKDPSASNPGGYYGSAGFTAESGQAAPVALGASGASGIDVMLPQGHLVSGVVRNSNGAPIAAQVEDCTTTICMFVTTAAADGSYVMNLAPGKHSVHVSDFSNKNVSGYYASAGLANYAHATSLTIGSADMRGIDVKLGKITGGVHPGTSHSGTYAANTTVSKGTYVTARFLVGKLFAGTKIAIMRSVKSSTGTWSAYKKVATVVVASNGYAYYSTKPSGYMAFKAALADSVASSLTYLSPQVYARGR